MDANITVSCACTLIPQEDLVNASQIIIKILTEDLLLQLIRALRTIDEKSHLLYLLTKVRFHQYFLHLVSFYQFQVYEYTTAKFLPLSFASCLPNHFV